MKKFMFTMVAFICFTATVFAAGNQPTTAKWNGEINSYKLGKYLNLRADQSEEVANICDYFASQMKKANYAKDNTKLLRNAIYGNLKLMKNVLSAKQYSKYAAVMNITLNNEGINLDNSNNETAEAENLKK